MVVGRVYQRLLLGVAAVAVIVGGVVLFIKPGLFWKWHGKPIYLAVVGPMSGPGAQNGQSMVEAIQLYVDMVNENGGVDSHDVELKVFDDRNDPEEARRVAREIVKNSEILTVLGHYYSSTSLVAGPIYKDAGVPVITASASDDTLTRDNEWYFRTVPNNSTQGEFLANYISKVLGIHSAAIIFDSDAYGVTLAESFAKASEEVGIEVLHEWSFSRLNDQLNEALSHIASEVKAMEKVPEMLFLATHAPEGAKLITLLKTPNAPFLFFGADAFSTKPFLRLLNESPQERARPGYFSNGIYMIAPFLVNIANEKAQEFVYRFKQAYGRDPGDVAAGSYDAAFVALEAALKGGVDLHRFTSAENRKLIRDYLSGLYEYEKALEGVNGPIFFNLNGDVVAPRFIALYQNQMIVSAFSQYQFVSNPRRVDNLLDKILDHEIFLIDQYLLKQTRVVYTGIDINEISHLDTSKFTYTFDFYLWFRFQGEFDDKAIEFVNAVDAIDLGEPVLEYKVDGVTTRAYRVKGAFRTRFIFSDYPFDRHALSIRFRHTKQKRNELIYAADILGMRATLSAVGRSPSPDADIAFSDTQDWKVLRAWFFQDTIHNNSTLGAPQLFNSKDTIDYSQFNASVLIERETLKFIIKQLFPLMLLAVVAYLAYIIPMTTDMRVNIGMSMLLTSTFFHSQVTSGLEVSYLLAIDYIFFTMYTLAVALIVISMRIFRINYSIKRSPDPEAVARMELSIQRYNLFGRYVHVATITGITLLFIYIYGK